MVFTCKLQSQLNYYKLVVRYYSNQQIESVIFSSVRVSTASYPRRMLVGGACICSYSISEMSILRPNSNFPRHIRTTLKIV